MNTLRYLTVTASYEDSQREQKRPPTLRELHYTNGCGI
jgi:hypothetical protein